MLLLTFELNGTSVWFIFGLGAFDIHFLSCTEDHFYKGKIRTRVFIMNKFKI
ncbi:hypothetical protein FUAX_09270 [Fulvitalea axinellae]|uniref:Uncharacterized protein n=1 Tax=Fulvitalea axinellae TaxID=1182444 RepID=A0AAU9CGZ0_9BACT|nr:hypothetical protein FUAX_09270 [Fulvitalea axinellae]